MRPALHPHITQAGERRYGRRVPVTEMIPLGLKGDRQMLIGGLAGWAMAPVFGGCRLAGLVTRY